MEWLKDGGWGGYLNTPNKTFWGRGEMVRELVALFVVGVQQKAEMYIIFAIIA